MDDVIVEVEEFHLFHGNPDHRDLLRLFFIQTNLIEVNIQLGTKASIH